MVVASILVTFAYGMSVRTTYTDLYRNHEWVGDDYKNCYCAALTDVQMTKHWMSFTEESVAELPYCIKCSPVSEPVVSYDNIRYEVEVLKVFRSEGDLHEGDIIWISRAWSVSQSQDSDEVYLELNFRNIMQQEQAYMVFFESVEEMKQTKYPEKIYMLPDYAIAPFFAYEDGTNVYMNPVSSDNTYIFYQPVADNEVFASDKEVADAYLTYKKQIINTYDKDAKL